MLSGVGSFGGLFALGKGVEDPVLVASADGVGTKLKVAFMTGIHDTIGVDLVNHCVNDILVQGARPLFFLDYLATGRLAPDVAEQIVTRRRARLREQRLRPARRRNGRDARVLRRWRVRRRRLHRRRSVSRAKVIDGRTYRGRRSSRRAAVVRPPHQRVFTGAQDRVRAPWPTRRESRRLSSGTRSAPRCCVRTGRISHAVTPLLDSGWIKGMAHITGGGITGEPSAHAA